MFGTLYGGGPFGQYGLYPQSQPPAPTQLRGVEIDWDNDATFGNAYSLVTDYVLSLETFRGRNDPNPLRGRCEPGTFKCVLDNRTGIFSPYFATSPLLGKLVAGRPVRWWMSAPISKQRWYGYITEITQGRMGQLPVTIIEAKGPLEQIANRRVNPPADSGSLTGTIVGKILDAADWAAGPRTIDAGQTSTSAWYINEESALAALREMEETEQGLLSEAVDGKIVYRDRAYRVSGARLTSQATYSDAPAASLPYLNPIQINGPNKDLVNVVRATVTPYSTGALAVLWTLSGETPTLGPGQSKTWFAKVSGDTLYVAAWTTPVSGTDYTVSGVALGDLGVVVVKAATTMKITITNNHVSNVATLTLLQARGTPVLGGTPTSVEAQDATSIAEQRSTRDYQLASKWLPNTNTAQSYVDSVLAQNKNPLAVVFLKFVASMTDALCTDLITRDLHDRVTVVAGEVRTALGLSGDFFIESIADKWDVQNSRHEVTLGLSQALATSGVWILGTSTLGTDTYLGY